MRQNLPLLVNFGFVYNDGVGCAACGRDEWAPAAIEVSGLVVGGEPDINGAGNSSTPADQR